ncbi:MAG: Spore protein SP21 [Candidatus Dichloromethanomonas elyunquensis]|nr:MAG: Spore protein SP21 [Candidatus Dichloromethanomonas elyunquensis]
MNMIPFDAMRSIDQMRREIDRAYRFPFSFFNDNFSQQTTLPFTDVYETDEQFIVSCDLPGLQRKEDVNLQIQDNELVVSGTLNREQHVIQEDRMHKKERFTGQFRRSVTLPASVSSENIRAIYKNGVLNIFLPKSGAGQKKSVNIEFQN